MTTATDAAQPALSLGSSLCQCATCGAFFRSVTAFDKHRTGTIDKDRRCLTAAEMIEAGMSVNERGFWITAVFNRTDLDAA